MKKELLVRIAVIVGIGLFLIPVIRLIWVFVEMYPKAYSLEIDQYRNVVTRYVYDRNAQMTNILEGMSDGRKKLGKIEDRDYMLDDYYAGLLKEYQIDEGNQEKSAESLKIKENRELGGISKNSTSSSKTVIGSREQDIIGGLSGLKVIHGYDDSESAKDKDNVKQNVEGKMTKEKDNGPGDSAFDESPSSRDVSELRVYPENHFTTSPSPSTSRSNVTEALSELRLVMNKDRYFRFEVIKANLISKRPVNLDDFKIYIVRDGYIFPNVGGDNDSFFKYRNQTIYATFTLGYNPPAGAFQILVKSKSNPNWAGISQKFTLIHRKVPSIQKGLSIVNWEYTTPIKNTEILGPNGEMGDWHNIPEWLSFMDVDAFWMLVCQTTGWDGNITAAEPWVKGGFENLDLLGPALKAKKIQVGAYFMTFFTPGNGKKLAGYDPGLGYEPSDNTLTDTRFISLSSEQRFQDLLKASKSFQANPNVDYIGLDFIRTGEADGLENGPQIIDDMNIPTPAYYEGLSQIDKVKYFGHLLQVEREPKNLMKWRWWRAHRVAEVVNRLLVTGNITKPVWVFTLGWEHGKQHGQDPYMFFDAGVTIDAAMLYEASAAQFNNLMAQWPAYMRNTDNNVIIGNSADTRLLDGRSENPAVEYEYRTKRGYREIYPKGIAKGIFIHDLSRMFWSTKRGLTTLEWAIVHGANTSDYRQECGLIPYATSLKLGQTVNRKVAGTLTIKNTSNQKISNLRVQYVATFPWATVRDNIPKSFTLGPKEVVNFTVEAELKGEYLDRESPLGYVIEHKDYRKSFVYGVEGKRDLKPFMVSKLDPNQTLNTRLNTTIGLNP